MKKLISTILLFSLCTFAYSCDGAKSVTEEEKISDCIENFVVNYNNGDVNAAIEYLAPKHQNSIKGIMSIMGMLIGIDVSVIFSALFSIGIETENGDYIDVEILEINIDKNKAFAKTNFSIAELSGRTEAIMYFILQKSEDVWYIYDITETEP